MKIAGIIAEYNPFHNGHAEQIRLLRSQYGFEGIVVCMSGCFTQRGEPALISKEARAKAAVASGADLVLELPVPYATGSAEFFAGGGVRLLSSLGCVDTLAFGMEDPDEEALKELGRRLYVLEHSQDYHMSITTLTKQGMSYPLARMRLLEEEGASDKELSLLRSPNDLLAVEYAKAVLSRQSSLELLPLLRKGAAYHEDRLPREGDAEDAHSSAKAIRTFLKTAGASAATPRLAAYLPKASMDAILSEQPVFPESFSDELYYQLIMHEQEGYSGFLDVSEDYSDKIRKLLPEYRGWESFAALLKSRDITASRISRMLLHILLGIGKYPFFHIVKNSEIPYGRILALNPDSPMLHELKDSPLPRFTNPYPYFKKLKTGSEKSLLALELLSEKLYHLKNRTS